MKKSFYIFLGLVLWVSGSCIKIGVVKPEGFAEMEEKGYYKAVSPEGVIYKVRTVENYPLKDLGFWSRALKKHLEDEGYRFVAEKSFNTTTNSGTLFEWGAPYGNEDYIYLTAILVEGKQIIIAEAAGEFSLFVRYREAIQSSLSTLTLR